MSYRAGFQTGVPGKPAFGLLGWETRVSGKPAFCLLGWETMVSGKPAFRLLGWESGCCQASGPALRVAYENRVRLHNSDPHNQSGIIVPTISTIIHGMLTKMCCARVPTASQIKMPLATVTISTSHQRRGCFVSASGSSPPTTAATFSLSSP